MRALVTGAAGFIGSHLAERLIKDGFEVVGIDCFTDYYQKDIKEKNISGIINNDRFKLIKENLLTADLKRILDKIDFVFHEAAQPGVRSSWGKTFSIYTEDNILSTQRLLESLKDNKDLPADKQVKKLVFASSSSVYGDAEKLPTKESFTPKPVSPYGVTKLAAENLCYLYSKNYGIPIISLRYFSVYGPRQRPDMAFNRFIRSIIAGKDITIYGNGKQTRDFTYISDIIEANIKVLNCKSSSGEVFNVGGGSRISVNATIKILEDLSGKKGKVKYIESQKGDVAHTSADISKAYSTFGYTPKVDIKAGLESEYEWIKRQE
ncbi:MAG: NAD-dependent epimerase/dehydratase family protein [bacterium]